MKLFKYRFHTWKISAIVVESNADAKRIIAKLLASSTKCFGLDIETAKQPAFLQHPRAGLDPRLSAIRLVQLYDGVRVWVFDAFKIDLQILAKLLSQRRFVAHNAKFELLHFHHVGIEIPQMECSMIMSSLVNRAQYSPFEKTEENEDEEQDGMAQYRSRVNSLDAVIGRLFGVAVAKAGLQNSDWGATHLTAEQYRYAALDAVLTHKAASKLAASIRTYKMGEVYKLYRALQYPIVEMEYNGVPVDWTEHRRLMKLWKVEDKKAQAETEKYFRGVNLNSPKQLNTWLEKALAKQPAVLRAWPRTASGKGYSFNKFHIKKFEKAKPIAALLAVKRVSRLIGTYGESLVEKKHPITGRIHCGFTIGHTNTGRLSCRDPNLQQIPRPPTKGELTEFGDRYGDMRKIFAAKDALLVVADFSQIEMRAAGEVSRDPVMLKAFKEGIDLHALIVSRVLNIPVTRVSKEQRQQGKPINFGFAFGMGWRKFRDYAANSYGTKFSDVEAQRAYRTYHSLYRGYSLWCKDQRARCERTSSVRTPMGMLRYLDKREVFTKAVNTPVQGGAAEVMFWSLVYLHAALKPFRAKLLLTIHDEIIVEVLKGENVEKIKRVVEKCMQRGLLKVFPNASTLKLVDAHEGQSWATAKAA